MTSLPLNIAQIISSLLVVGLVLLQQSDEGVGGSVSLTNSNVSKRGWEKTLFSITIASGIIFIVLSSLGLLFTNF